MQKKKTEEEIEELALAVISKRESRLDVMRAMRDSSDRHLEKYRWMISGNGYPVGSAHFDEFLYGESLAVFLRFLNQGHNINESYELAKAETKEMVKLWNAKPYAMWFWSKHEVQRWEEFGSDKLDYWWRRLLDSL